MAARLARRPRPQRGRRRRLGRLASG